MVSTSSSTGERTEIAESELIRWWLSLEDGTRLSPLNGPAIYLLSHGSRNNYDGPDFLGARLMVDDQASQGDVEFHIHERDWFAHRHHKDSRYDNVILHIVARGGIRRAVTGSGRPVPLLEIRPDRIISGEEVFCQLTDECDEKTANEALRRMAKIRWMRALYRMHSALREMEDTREAFYVQSFWSLGLKGNEYLFERLSRSLPLSTFSNLRDHREVLAVLLGVSGLFDSELIEEDLSVSEWSSFFNELHVKEMFSSDLWRRKGVRPSAFPERRMGLGARIVWALLEGWEPWKNGVQKTLSDIEAMFRVKVSAKGWYSEWLGNVIIPFQEALEELQHEQGGDERFLRWFELDLGYTYGKVSRQFSPYLKQKQLTNFGMQQGLLSLQERYCETNLCRLCPLRE